MSSATVNGSIAAYEVSQLFVYGGVTVTGNVSGTANLGSVCRRPTGPSRAAMSLLLRRKGVIEFRSGKSGAQ